MRSFSRTGLCTLAIITSMVATALPAQTTTIDTNGVVTEEDAEEEARLKANGSADHEVFIIDGAYFPPLVYANPGDRIIFQNVSSGTHVIEGPEESWSSGEIPMEGFFRLRLTDSTPLTYRASAETEGTSAEEGDIVLEQIGEITYDAPPSSIVD